MSRKMTLLALAGLAAHSSGASAADMFSFNAYGTIGVVHSSEDKADFVGTVYQPNGAGYTRSWDFGPDSKLAGQVQAKFNDKFSAIVQVVAQHQYDSTYTPQLEWANIKYAITSDLDVRAGRIVLPIFLFSESRNVGYSNPWIRAPQEIYALNTITSNDGGDVTYRFKVGRSANSAQAFYGTSEVKFPGDSKTKAKPSWGISDTMTLGDLTLRVGYVSQKIDLVNLTMLDPLFNGLTALGNGLTAFGFQPAGAQTLALVQKYSLSGMTIKNSTVGVNYDPGQWFVTVEGDISKSEGFLPDSKSWYVTGGYRIAKVTPYVTYASISSDVATESGIDTTGLPLLFAAGANQLLAGINGTRTAFAASQTTTSLGVRWDFISSAALKVQYDHLSLGANSSGRFANMQPGFVPGGTASLFSAAIDFVF